MIYFDNSATTQIDESVLKTYQQVSEKIMGNPSSLHELGNQSSRLLDQCRKQIAELMGVDKKEIFFTSGGTEGDNWAIKGTAFEKMTFGRHLITTTIEHPAVKETFIQLERMGFEVTYVPVTSEGYVVPEDIEKAIRPDTTLVSVIAVNNEIGSIQPIEEISHILSGYPSIHFHVDTVQALARVPFNLSNNSRIDLAVFSGHKFHGPRGTGFLYKKASRKIQPLLSGGGQESGLRSGTENIPGIAAMARALRLQLENVKEKNQHLSNLRANLLNILKKYPLVTIFSPENSAPHILCFGICGIKGEVVVHALEKENIYVSTTSACSSKKGMTHTTLQAMHLPEKVVETSVRMSLASTNTIQEVDHFAKIFDKIYHQFERLSR